MEAEEYPLHFAGRWLDHRDGGEASTYEVFLINKLNNEDKYGRVTIATGPTPLR